MTLNTEEITEETILDPAEDLAESPADDPAAQDTHEDENEVVITIGDEKTPEDETHAAPAWVKELRKSHRELLREKKELETRLNALTTETKPAVQIGKKPTLEDFDYEAEKYETALAGWFDRKRQVDQEEQQRQDAMKKQEEAWQGTLANYGKLKAEVKVKDFAEAEAEVETVLNQTQRGIILQGADNPALVVYALGKNPAKAKELAAISDPVKYAFAIAKLEDKLKVTARKPATEPERVITGTGPKSGTVDSQLERLREEAAKTGDSSKVLAYKRQKQNPK